MNIFRDSVYFFSYLCVIHAKLWAQLTSFVYHYIVFKDVQIQTSHVYVMCYPVDFRVNFKAITLLRNKKMKNRLWCRLPNSKFKYILFVKKKIRLFHGRVCSITPKWRTRRISLKSIQFFDSKSNVIRQLPASSRIFLNILLINGANTCNDDWKS